MLQFILSVILDTMIKHAKPWAFLVKCTTEISFLSGFFFFFHPLTQVRLQCDDALYKMNYKGVNKQQICVVTGEDRGKSSSFSIQTIILGTRKTF